MSKCCVDYRISLLEISTGAGYEDVNDAKRLCADPALRYVVGGSANLPEKQAASASEVGRFETDMLSQRQNLTELMSLSGQWIDKVHQRQPLKQLILDMDSSVSETYGDQEGTAYNGHFECTCYHPLFLFNQLGDLECAMLRRGNKASAKFWRRALLPAIERYRDLDIPKFFLGVAFAPPKLMRLLEARATSTPSRSRPTPCWNGKASTCSPARQVVRRASRRSFTTAFATRRSLGSGRVITKNEWHVGELFPCIGFIVTNLTKHSKNVVKFYSGRETAEQWIKEGKNAIKWTKLSCRTFKDNQTRLQLFALA